MQFDHEIPAIANNNTNYLVISFFLNFLSYEALIAREATKEQSETTVCLIERLDTAMIILGSDINSSGRIHPPSRSFCFMESSSNPLLSLKVNLNYYIISKFWSHTATPRWLHCNQKTKLIKALQKTTKQFQI